MKIYCIKDTKVGFMQPFLQPNDAVAVREFSNIINFRDNVVSTNYMDMELYCLGDFNSDNGEISHSLSFLIKGSDVKKVNENV